jgi:enoyl-CoA hydratase
MAGPVDVTRIGRTTRIVMDDGKVNAMNPAMLEALHAAFDQAARDETVAVLSSGRPIFSAGFDLKLIASGEAAAVRHMLNLGGELALKVLSFPTPVITVTAGHAYPQGAFLVLSADWRIGAEGDWRIGLNEVRIGMTIPTFALEVARQRLLPAYFSRTAMTGEMYGPAEALTAGFLDELVPAADLDDAVEAAIRRMDGIGLGHHAATKRRARGAAIAAVRAAIDAEIPPLGKVA